MAAVFRPYTSQPGFSDDYHKVHRFLIDINRERVTAPGFLWGRWAWAFCLPFQDTASLHRIGIWEEDSRIAALATYETAPGEVYLITRPGHEHLKKPMLEYAIKALSKDGRVRALIADTDRAAQQYAKALGFCPTRDQEHNAAMNIDLSQIDYSLPTGYSVTSLADTFDMPAYNRVLWRGFDHEGEPPTDEKQLADRRKSVSSPYDNMSLKIAVAAPDGAFVSYCGMWYDPATPYALVEPVATDPAYRRMGLGKAAVLEGIRRCGQLGAKTAYVGSSQPFYYAIGFKPTLCETFWEYTH